LLPAVSTVIASEGVSGIPEAMIELTGRGVLDAPLSRSMTVIACGWTVTPARNAATNHPSPYSSLAFAIWIKPRGCAIIYPTG
jgi:hypothetical protein